MTTQTSAEISERSETADGMRIDWDVPVPMADGTILRADVFRPDDEGVYPVMMTPGRTPRAWHSRRVRADVEQPVRRAPGRGAGSNNRTRLGDRRPGEVGPGRVRRASGSIRAAPAARPDCWTFLSAQETRDYYECIEWAGTQRWSNGKVGLLGISYYAVNQWLVAALRPPHLAAICPWEGFTDYLPRVQPARRHPHPFRPAWQDPRSSAVQHGVGERGRATPTPVSWSPDPDADRRRTRREPGRHGRRRQRRELLDEFAQARTPDLERIRSRCCRRRTGAHHLHTRGNFEGYARVRPRRSGWKCTVTSTSPSSTPTTASTCRSGSSATSSRARTTGWDDQPPVRLNVRHVDGTFEGARRTGVAAGPHAVDARSTSTRRSGATGTDEPPRRGQRPSSRRWGPVSTFWTDAADRAAGDHRAGVAPGSVCPPRPPTPTCSSPCACRTRTGTRRHSGGRDGSRTVCSAWAGCARRTASWTSGQSAVPPVAPASSKQPLTPGEAVELDVEIWPTSVVVPSRLPARRHRRRPRLRIRPATARGR